MTKTVERIIQTYNYGGENEKYKIRLYERSKVLKDIMNLKSPKTISELLKIAKSTEPLFKYEDIYKYKTSTPFYSTLDYFMKGEDCSEPIYDKYYLIRQALARNVNISKKIKSILAGDKNIMVQNELLYREDLNSEFIEEILKGLICNNDINTCMSTRMMVLSTTYSIDQVILHILMHRNFTNYNIFNEVDLSTFKECYNWPKRYPNLYIPLAHKFKWSMKEVPSEYQYIEKNLLDLDTKSSDEITKIYFDAKKKIHSRDVYNEVLSLIFDKQNISKISKEIYQDIGEKYPGYLINCPYTDIEVMRKFVSYPPLSDENWLNGRTTKLISNPNVSIEMVNLIIQCRENYNDFDTISGEVLRNKNIDFSLLQEDFQKKLYSIITDEISHFDLKNAISILKSKYTPDEVLIEKSRIKNLHIQLALLENPKFIKEVYQNLVDNALTDYVREIASKKLKEIHKNN